MIIIVTAAVLYLAVATVVLWNISDYPKPSKRLWPALTVYSLFWIITIPTTWLISFIEGDDLQ